MMMIMIMMMMMIMIIIIIIIIQEPGQCGQYSDQAMVSTTDKS